MNNVGSLVFYLFAFSLSAFLMYYGNKRGYKVIVWLSLAIPIIVSGLRFNVGTDYTTYVAMYNDLSHLSLTQYLSIQPLNLEIGFYLLAKLSSFMMGDHILLFTLSSILTVVFLYLGLNQYSIKHKALVYFLFLTITFPFTFDLVRQGIAMSICFFAFSFIIKHKPKKYVPLIIMAGLFHESALFLLPFYFINRLVGGKINNYNRILIKSLLLASILLLSLPYIYNLLQAVPLFSKYLAYQSEIVSSGANNIFYLNFIIIMATLLLYKRIVSLNSKNIYFYVFTIIYLILLTLGFTSPFVKRIALYFSLFSPLILASTVDVFSDKLGKFICYTLLIAYGLLYFYLSFYLMGQADIFPYHFVTWSSL